MSSAPNRHRYFWVSYRRVLSIQEEEEGAQWQEDVGETLRDVTRLLELDQIRSHGAAHSHSHASVISESAEPRSRPMTLLSPQRNMSYSMHQEPIDSHQERLRPTAIR